MRYLAFLEAWFELADFWVEVLDKQRYVDFIRMCYDGISMWKVSAEDGVRVWKGDAEIYFNTGFFGEDKLEDDFYIGHDHGEGSLDDVAGLFSGMFNFSAVTPYSASRLLDLILDIYEARIKEMMKKKEKHRKLNLQSLAQHRILVIGEILPFQEFIVAWFRTIYPNRAATLLSELKSFIVGCFQQGHPRIQMFKYFFSQPTYDAMNADDTLSKGRSNCLNHAMDLMATVFPNLRLRQEFLGQVERYGHVYCKKLKFMDAFHHSVPHVPRAAASYQAFLFDLKGMLNFKHPQEGTYHSNQSLEGKAIYRNYR